MFVGQSERLCYEASETVAVLLQIKPEFSCRYAREHLFYLERDEQVEEYVDALREAGVPD